MAFSPETYGLIKGLNGKANGFASLNGNGKVPETQLPSYIDDIEEYASLASFPEEGETGVIYLALDTGDTYRWSGSAYVSFTTNEIFYCTYDSTTSSAIDSALSAGKLPVVIEDGKFYIYSLQPDSTTDHLFTCCHAASNTIVIDVIRCYLDNSTTVWSKSTTIANLATYASLASPAFTGTPTAPTAAANTNTTQLATTAFVQNAIAGAIGGSY